MAYADRDATGTRIVAGVVVAVILVVVGYAFVTGLAYQFVKKVKTDLTTVDVAPPPPPPPPEVPPPPPPPNPQTVPPPPQIVSPPPIVNVPTVSPPIATVPTAPPVVIAPPAPVVVPTAPGPPHISQAAGLKGNLQQYYGPDNYPAAALRANAQGRVVAHLTVGADGRVSDCSIATSSGNEDLDSTTCRIAKSRVRFTPAKDDSGRAIASTYNLPVRWQLPSD